MMPVHGAFHEGNPDATLSDSLHTVDLNTHTAISSMAVEFSLGSDDIPTSAPKRTAESVLRPAAEVFGFLLEKRRPRSSMSMNLGSPLPAPRTSLDLKSSRGHVHDAPTTPLYTEQSPTHLRLAEVSASTDTASTPGSILVDPPHTATILNHTRIPIVHGRPRDCSHAEQPTTTVITTRASRIPRGRRSLQLPSDRRTSLSETHLSPISPAEPIRPTQTPTCRSDTVRPTPNAVERQSTDSHLPHKQDPAIIGPVPMRSAHRRSVSYGSSRPIPHDWNAGLDAIRAARMKGPKPDDGNKENIIATTENANMCPFSSFALM
ncbi:hypothetical protein BC826DRAFT_67857 [Russula brevipes]|nr:hypothetical protein BC826DRAFT_67857 [Russula brevipes]